MTPVKFECPGCGQHLECDRACCGDVIHCPRCCAELRIPFATGQEIPGMIARAELILHAPSAGPAQAIESPKPGGAAERPATAPLDVSCPICHSELRVKPAEPAAATAHPSGVAEVLRAAPIPQQPQKSETHNEQPHPDMAHMSLEERERHIAAAREARPVSLYGSMKPRLDKVLSSELAPVKHADEKAPQPVPRPAQSAAPPHEKTLSE